MKPGNDRTHYVADWMSQPPLVVHRDAKSKEAIFLMKKNSVRLLPVVDDANEVIGVITDRDLRDSFSDLESLSLQNLYLKNGELSVCDVMTTDVRTVTAEDTIISAANIIVANKIHGLPVVAKPKSNELVGVITNTDLLEALLYLDFE